MKKLSTIKSKKIHKNSTEDESEITEKIEFTKPNMLASSPDLQKENIYLIDEIKSLYKILKVYHCIVMFLNSYFLGIYQKNKYIHSNKF